MGAASPFLSGAALGLSLILAIGAQNAFVLRQGIRREHVGVVVLVCAVSDAVLILAGVAGFGALVEAMPAVETIARWGGAAFLFVYGALSFRRAATSDETLAAKGISASLGATIATALTLTWANPHVYLDTVVLLGAVAATFGPDRWAFGAGAVTSSFLFFTTLGYGARALAPVFARPVAWRVLDALVGLLMWALAILLISP